MLVTSDQRLKISLNGDDLVSRGREDKEKLLTGLKEKLESLTYDKLMEQEATRAENMIKQLNYIPLPAHAVIRVRVKRRNKTKIKLV